MSDYDWPQITKLRRAYAAGEWVCFRGPAADEIEAQRARAEAAEAEARSWQAVAKANQATAQSHADRWAKAEAERDRLRELIAGIKGYADEWCVSRMTGNPQLENEKGEKMWQAIRRASAMTAPIEASDTVTGGGRGDGN